MASSKPPGLFCLEGDWDDSLQSRLSVEPSLQLLERAGSIRLIHRDVGTREELEHYLNRWLTPTKNKTKGFDLAYFGFHGSRESIWIGAVELTFTELETIINGRCKGKVLIFASCKALAASDETLMSFCRNTGAKAIVGYTRDVGWVESAAFELLLIERLAPATLMKPVYTSLMANYPDLTTKLGFRMAHATWASDRRIAAEVINAGPIR